MTGFADVGAWTSVAQSRGDDQLLSGGSIMLPLESRQSTTCSKPHAMGGAAVIWHVGSAFAVVANATSTTNEKASVFNGSIPAH